MRWIIDTDPGIDDAAAIITSLNLGIMDVAGITTVHGNVGLDLTTTNALRLVELTDRPVPVFRGTEQALLEPPRRASEFHGSDGFGDTGLPAPRRKAESVHAVDFIIDAAHDLKGGLSILTLGPLTNLATALVKDRKVAGEIAEVVMMGGTSRARGNTTPLAEFNVFADPEAAQVVLTSGIPVRMVPWETCLDAMLGTDTVVAARQAKSAAAQAFAKAADLVVSRIKARLGVEGLLLCDLVAACVAMDPAVAVDKQAVAVEVETGGRLSRGLTVVDERPRQGNHGCVELCLRCDSGKVRDMFLSALQKD